MTEAALWLGDTGAADRFTMAVGVRRSQPHVGHPHRNVRRRRLYLGELESLCGNGSPVDRFEAALDLAERTDAPLHIARTLSAHAAHLHRADPASPDAAVLADRARAIAEPAGMVRVLKLLDADAEAVAWASGASGASALQPGGLSAREREVIGLIAEGRSNRRHRRRSS